MKKRIRTLFRYNGCRRMDIFRIPESSKHKPYPIKEYGCLIPGLYRYKVENGFFKYGFRTRRKAREEQIQRSLMFIESEKLFLKSLIKLNKRKK